MVGTAWKRLSFSVRRRKHGKQGRAVDDVPAHVKLLCNIHVVKYGEDVPVCRIVRLRSL